jgi:hypothetical protein
MLAFGSSRPAAVQWSKVAHLVLVVVKEVVLELFFSQMYFRFVPFFSYVIKSTIEPGKIEYETIFK